jgi:class 3 adenylate cyclase
LAAARREFEVVAARNFENIPADPNYLVCLALLADVATSLEDAPRCQRLYEMLAPYPERCVFTQAGPCMLSSVQRSLGMTAAVCGRIDQAIEHFDAAIRREREVGIKPAVPRTQFFYARALARTGELHHRERALELVNEALDLATEYGMKTIVESCLALKLELQGVTSSDMRESIMAVADTVDSHRPDMSPHAAPDGTVTLMLSDMVNFTLMTERLGDLRARDIVREHNRIIREQIASNQGYEVDTAGDGFLVAFKSARFGLACAIAIQRALEAHNAAAEEPIHVRIGLHTGEALKDADKFFGRTVILAARIGAQASAGQILVSSLIKELSASVGDVAFGEAREVELKGIAEKQRVVEVRWQ